MMSADNMSNSLDKVTENEFTAIKVEVREESTSNVKEECENDYTRNNISVDDACIKDEPYEIDNYTEDNKLNVHKTISQEYSEEQMSFETDNLGDEIAVQERAACVNTEIDEIYDKFEYVAVKNEPCSSDLFSCCEECGTEYVGYCTKCPMLLHILHNNASSSIEDEGERTLPKDILEIRQSLDQLGVFALKTVPKGVIFGPFYGLISVQSTTGCFWKVENGKPVYPEDANSLNWMQYIVCTKNISQMNLIPFQCRGKLYYQSDREISEGEELSVCYSEGRDVTDVEAYYHPNIKIEIGDVYACILCCLGFSSQANLLKHKTKCPYTRNDADLEEIIQCPFCEIYLVKTEFSEFHTNYCNESFERKCVPSLKSSESVRGSASDVLQTCKRSKRGNKTKEKRNLGRIPKVHDDVESMDRRPFQCEICKNRFTQKSTLTAHMRIHSGEKPFECQICKTHFARKSTLTAHMRTHNGEKPFECEICKKYFRQQSHLREHMGVHNRKKPFECEVCNKSFLWRQNLKTHLRTHTGGKTVECKIECKICKKRVTQSYLRVHIRTHMGEKPFGCNICGKSFITHSQLRRHVLTHSGEKPFGCEICKKSFGVRGELNRHLLMHTGEKPFKCKICEARFRQKSDLTVHVRTHTGEKPFECKMCERRFTRQSHLSAHIRTHLGQKPPAPSICYKSFLGGGKTLQCEICNEFFGAHEDLKRHFVAHTRERPFECKICDKRFIRKSDLTVHLRRHSGEKPYKCEICNKSFGIRGDVSRHLRTHTGEKPFECETCKKCFTQKSVLRVHMLVHSGEKPFECAICEKLFGRKDYLKKHIRTQHSRELPLQ